MNTVLTSGGVDSAYLLGVVDRDGGRGISLFVDYGQPSARMEARAASVLAKAFQWTHRSIKVEGSPLGDMADGIGAHIVPARNLWLASLAAAWGKNVWIGCAPQDERDYEDCRLGFLDGLDKAFGQVGKSLRWSNASRAEREEYLRKRELLDFCWSCYGPGPDPCGECASCLQ